MTALRNTFRCRHRPLLAGSRPWRLLGRRQTSPDSKATVMDVSFREVRLYLLRW
jgi:hypothetical protein